MNRILLVEDEASHAMLVRRAFEDRATPVSLTVAGTLAEARAAVAERVPDIAIIDLRLPDGDGIEFLTTVPRERSYPVVIMTSHGDEQVAVEAMKAGALDYVVKSEAMLSEMPRIVERVLRAWEHIVVRRKAEEDLRRSENRFRGLFAHVPVSIWEEDFTDVKAYLDGLPLGPEDRMPAYLERHPDVVGACARRVQVLGVNQASVELFEACDAEGLMEALPKVFAEEMYGSFKQQLIAVAEGAHLLDLETSIRTLHGEKRAITLRWAVPPGHEETYSRVLVSIVDITDRKRLEKEVLEATTQVQRRIGRDLHDGLGQLLAGTRFKIARLIQRLRRRDVPEVEMASEVDALVAEAISQARALARGLNPVSMEVGGLAQALEDLTQGICRIYGIRCTIDCADADLIQDQEVAGQVYYIAQEALNNATKHGEATEVHVTLEREYDWATLVVRDNGRGLPPAQERRDGQGLRIMAYRAGIIHGTLDVRRADEGGTIVACHFRTHTLRPPYGAQAYGTAS